MKRPLLLLLFALLLAACAAPQATRARETGRDYQRVVVLSDPHYGRAQADGASGGKESSPDLKLRAVEDVNSWEDVDLVAVTGDIVAKYGSEEEYARAARFLRAIRKPKAVIAGNHEYMYADAPEGGKLVRGTPQERSLKLDRFRRYLGVPELHYTVALGQYLLVFLSPDVTDGGFLTEISSGQLAWLSDTLQAHPGSPTLIFFHAPLKGTLDTYSEKINSPQRVAQPEKAIHAVLMANPQVKAWVSGHTHTPPTQPSFLSDVNLYHGRVVGIHNTDMNRKTIWTNSIFLYDDKIVIRTWNHAETRWEDGLERTITVK